jgi:hypothetical protein
MERSQKKRETTIKRNDEIIVISGRRTIGNGKKS